MAVGFWGLALAAILVALGLFMSFRRRSLKLMNLPPGPPGIPVLGNLLLLSGPKLPHVALTELSKRYGPLMFFRLGSTPCIVVSSSEVCRQIVRDEDRAFASRPANSAFQNLMYGHKGLVFAPMGDHWRQLRKVVTLELLTQRRIREFESLRVAETSAMLGAVHHHSTLHGSRKPVNLRLMLNGLTFNFITQMCFSKRFYEYPFGDPAVPSTSGKETEDSAEFMHLYDQMNELLPVQLIGDFIPYLSFLDRFTGFKHRMIKLHNRFDHLLGKILEEHRRQHRKPADSKLDFVEVLLGLLDTSDGSDLLDDTVIKAVCMEILGAGAISASSTMEWIMIEILRTPTIAAKLKAELDAVVGKERPVTESDIPNLPYLQALVKEGLRLHPSGPLLVPRESSEQTKIMGYAIPKGTTLLFNVYAVHRDPAFWDNPMVFQPERFLDNEVDVKGQHYQLLPFGAGRRGCPAVSLALVMLQYGLARLLQAFDWSLPQGMRPEDVNLEEAAGMSVSSAHALEAVATPRLPSLLY